MRRSTYRTDEAMLEVQQAGQARITSELPEAPVGADKQAISAEGAFVPLVGGEWAEVKTLVVAQVGRDQHGKVWTRQISSPDLISKHQFE